MALGSRLVAPNTLHQFQSRIRTLATARVFTSGVKPVISPSKYTQAGAASAQSKGKSFNSPPINWLPCIIGLSSVLVTLTLCENKDKKGTSNLINYASQWGPIQIAHCEPSNRTDTVQPFESPPFSHKDYHSFRIVLPLKTETAFTGDLLCPFKTPAESDTKALQSWIAKEALKTGYFEEGSKEYKKFLKSNFSYLVDVCYPDFSLEDKKKILILVMFLFKHDDWRDDESSPVFKNTELLRNNNNHLISLMTSTVSKNIESLDPLIKTVVGPSWKELVSKLKDKKNFHHFILAMEGYFKANYWEASNRKSGAHPSLPCYIERRQDTSAVFAAFEIGAALKNLKIPKQVRENIEFKAMRSKSCNAICYANDIYSSPKEIFVEAIGENLLKIIFTESQDWGKALKTAIHLHDSEVTEFLDSKKRFLEYELEPILLKQPPVQQAAMRKDVMTYITLMEDWMAGNLAWSKQTIRYK